MPLMTRQEAIEALAPGLGKAIQEWTDASCESEAWVSLEMFVGEDLTRLMAKAAMAVLESQADLSAYYKREQMLE